MKRPIKSGYATESQLHAAFMDYAESKNINTMLKVMVKYSDGSVFMDMVDRAQEEIRYTGLVDSTPYEVYYRGRKFVDMVYSDGEPVGINEMKRNIYNWLLERNDTPFEVYFTVVAAPS